MNNNHVYDMLVVGGGPGGYTAALYAARAGLDTIVLEKLSAGGQMALTEQIDNYPGFENGIDGFSLAENTIYLLPGEERCVDFRDANGVPKVHYTYCSIRGKLFNCTCCTKDEAQRLCEDWLIKQDRCYIN